MDNSDGQSGNGSVPGRKDVLRARDIIPGVPSPNENATQQEASSPKTSENKPSPPAVPQRLSEREPDSGNVAEKHAEQIKPVEDVSATAAETEQTRSEIPKFDLAEKIMAEQRRITAVRRKAPGQNDETGEQHQESVAIGNTSGWPAPMLSELEQIIADIVSRDIEGLCRGGTLSVHNR